MGLDLRTTYLGLELRNPLVASASPLTAQLETLLRLEEAGAAAVVMPSLFEEQFDREERAIRELPETRTTDFAASLWAAAESPVALVRQSEAILVAKVLATAEASDQRYFVSGTHDFNSLVTVEVLDVVKLDDPPSLAAGEERVLLQFSHRFEGGELPYDSNPPLEPERTYLLFLARNPDTGALQVGDPFIQQVVDGRLYWAGARAHIEEETDLEIGYDPDDPLMAFWDVPLNEAVAQLKGLAAAEE